MTIDWTQAPPWARYAAMEPDGTWFWYAEAPILRSRTWVPRDARFEIKSSPLPDWTQTLTERPTE